MAPGARPRCGRGRRQRGVTLIELLVGLALGLLVVTAGIGTLLLSRTTSSAVTDLSQLQQQGAFALRIIGLQLRQTGSMDPKRELDGLYAFDKEPPMLAGTHVVVQGTDGGSGPDTVSVAALPAPWSEGAGAKLWQHDCRGGAMEAGETMDAVFSLSGGELVCSSRGANLSLIRNVADFQALYRVDLNGTARFMTATEVTDANLWDSVAAIEICLDLTGTENLPDTGAEYTNCHNAQAARGTRAHLVFRNTFALRTRSL